MKALILALILTSVLISCKKGEILKDDELTLKRESYLGNELRIDGYYQVESPSTEWSRVYFFYRNGVFIETYINTETGEFEDVENYSKSRIGTFRISEDSIKYEKWYPSSGGGLPTYLHSGTITNDSTYLLTKSIRPATGDESTLDEVFHFIAYSPKPDSTNNFVD